MIFMQFHVKKRKKAAVKALFLVDFESCSNSRYIDIMISSRSAWSILSIPMYCVPRNLALFYASRGLSCFSNMPNSIFLLGIPSLKLCVFMLLRLKNHPIINLCMLLGCIILRLIDNDCGF